MNKQTKIDAALIADELKGKWYVLYVQNNKEFKVKNSLPFSCIIPVVQEAYSKKIGDTIEKRSRIVPKFKNYIYVQHDGSKDFFERCLLEEGVSYWVGPDKGLPNSISDEEIDRVIKTEIKKNIFIQGCRVKIIDGFLKNIEGIVTKVETESCNVAFSILDHEMKEDVPKEYLILAE